MARGTKEGFGGATLKVVSLTERLEQRENAYWDRQARAMGFANFAELEKVATAEWDAEFERLQAGCSHPDKHPDLGMCVACADKMSA